MATNATITSIQLPDNSICTLSDAAAVKKSLLTTKGDIIYASGVNTPARLGIGDTGAILTVNSNGIPAWLTDFINLKKNNIIINATTNGITSNQFICVNMNDNNNYTFAQLYGSAEIDDYKTQICIKAFNKNSNEQTISNQFVVGVKKDGTQFYSVSNPTNFKAALGIKRFTIPAKKNDVNGMTTLTIANNNRSLIFGNNNTGGSFMGLIFCDADRQTGYYAIANNNNNIEITTSGKSTDNNFSPSHLIITNKSNRDVECMVIIISGGDVTE